VLVDNKLYLFGGAYNKGSSSTNFHSFYECFLKLDSPKEDLFKWKRIMGEAPKSRDSHSCISFLDQILLFGGSINNKSNNDIYKFNITSKIWTKLEPLADPGNQPTPREGHVATLIDGDKMLVHGGINEKEQCFGDAYVLVGTAQRN
jgi:N-acetylneuraminic acid mutarotase